MMSIVSRFRIKLINRMGIQVKWSTCITFAILQIFLPYSCSGLATGLPAQEWCNYVSNSPEPDIIFYNRAPKCGSTTMVSIAETSCKIGRGCSMIDYQSKYWKPVTTEIEQQAIYKFASKRKRENEIAVLHGHVPNFPFNASHVSGSKRMEFMQLYRNCVDRYSSSFVYDILDSLKAKTAKSNHSYNAYVESLFDTVHWEGCVMNKTCLLNSSKYKSMRVDEYWYYTVGRRACNGSSLCQYSAEKGEEFKHKFEPREGNYIAFGLLEEMEKYLELLECVYPTIFSGNTLLSYVSASFANNKNKSNLFHLP